MTIEEIEREIVDEFSIFDDWMDKYAYLIEIGSGLEGMDEAHKTDDNLIKGCQSRVWFYMEIKNGLLYFMADSDAIITKGIAGLLIRVFSGQKPADIVKADLHFIDEIGLTQHLSPTRSNGLLSMVKQIKMYAIAAEAKLQQQMTNNKTMTD
ncbi:MAG: SufE family protein [Odoribacter sp.]